MMKKRYNLGIMFILADLFLAGCGNDFLDIAPSTQITTEAFWNSPADVRLYANSYYENKDWLPRPIYGMGTFELDRTSDNMVATNYDTYLNGEGTIPVTTDLKYKEVYSLNYFLANYQNNGLTEADVAQYVGETYFFRAYSYFQKLVKYGDVQRLDEPVNTSSPGLYVGRTPRNVNADLILKDLSEAIRLLSSRKTMKERRVTKEVALLMKSRVALFEGSWEKYHNGTVFGVPNPDWDKYFRIAAEASDSLINMGTCALDNVGVKDGYAELFRQSDYTNSKEILLWRNYVAGKDGGHSRTGKTEESDNNGITKSLVDAYLDINGLPIKAAGSVYHGDETLYKTVLDRDPRLAQTIMVPGHIVFKKNYKGGLDSLGYKTFRTPNFTAGANNTGYQIYKGLDIEDANRRSEWQGISATYYFRYAEALLNFAEAKAELGTLTQGDLDKSINLLRDRVGMPHMVLGNIPDDPERAKTFPEISPLLYEIRRERRVELALEGFRKDDLRRWAAYGKLIRGWHPLGANAAQWSVGGVRIEGLTGAADTTGTGMMDHFVIRDGHISVYQLREDNGKITNPLPDGYGVVLNRDYLEPYPSQEIMLNPGKVYQNPNW